MYRNILVPISFDEDREVDRPLEIARQRSLHLLTHSINATIPTVLANRLTSCDWLTVWITLLSRSPVTVCKPRKVALAGVTAS